MWTEITRPRYQRSGLRYASDTTDGEWAVIEPLMPPPHKGRGRRRTTPLRAVVNAIFYIAQSGCQGRMLPKDFPTLYHGAALLLSLARQRPVAADQPCPAD